MTTSPYEGLALNSSFISAHSAAANFANQNEYNNSFACDYGQIFSPIQINRRTNESSTDLPSMRSVGVNPQEYGNFATRTQLGPGFRGVVPYGTDLDPYFFDAGDGDGFSIIDKKPDLNTVVNRTQTDVATERDLTLARATSSVQQVRTVGLRGPLLLSSWGYDIGDKPVPNRAFSGDDSFYFAAETPNDRAEWKTGPIHLMWDDERQVWTGGLPMLMGVATSAVTPPDDPTLPTKFTMDVLRHNGTDAQFIQLPGSPESIEVYNYDPSIDQELITLDRSPNHSWPDNPSLVWVLAVKMNYKWIPFYVGCPPECVTPEHCATLKGGEPNDWECEDGYCEPKDSNGGGSGGCVSNDDCPEGECCYPLADGSGSACSPCIGL